MTSRIGRSLGRILAGALAATSVGLYAGGALGAESLGVFDYWTAWTDSDDSGKICYVSATPQSSEPTNVNRGPIHFLVTIRPTNRNEVATIVGYPIHETNPNASASVDGRSYPMVTQGESAWLASIEDEPGFVEAMKAGATLIVRATSQRGTNTVDTYSLVGITAALNRAAEECPR
ncbi:invasion associated locus B family protein [Pelagibacterium xiamenense]|uniref:invasion associated locus B family protein n=1 Tax=Pelagibacterium xiamenense TaxID=2901140 RepID=UPI001E3A5DD1|nr:invasion associated locus B family protein [Pelagibacterium xiamenense]MCD7058368.1 invasion associated locus B family protein [Pelagibacterium xiamenense]